LEQEREKTGALGLAAGVSKEIAWIIFGPRTKDDTGACRQIAKEKIALSAKLDEDENSGDIMKICPGGPFGLIFEQVRRMGRGIFENSWRLKTRRGVHRGCTRLPRAGSALPILLFGAGYEAKVPAPDSFGEKLAAFA